MTGAEVSAQIEQHAADVAMRGRSPRTIRLGGERYALLMAHVKGLCRYEAEPPDISVTTTGGKVIRSPSREDWEFRQRHQVTSLVMHTCAGPARVEVDPKLFDACVIVDSDGEAWPDR